MENEYNSLRQEIMYLLQKRDEYTRFAYTAATLLLAAAFAIQNRLIIVLNMILILPISVRITEAVYSATRLASYIAAFLEDGVTLQWETRNLAYREKYKSGKKDIIIYIFGRADLIVLQAVNMCIFWIYAPTEDIVSKLPWLQLVIFILQICAVVIEIYLCHRSSAVDKARVEMIEEWKIVKREIQTESKATAQNQLS